MVRETGVSTSRTIIQTFIFWNTPQSSFIKPPKTLAWALGVRMVLCFPLAFSALSLQLANEVKSGSSVRWCLKSLASLLNRWEKFISTISRSVPAKQGRFLVVRSQLVSQGRGHFMECYHVFLPSLQELSEAYKCSVKTNWIYWQYCWLDLWIIFLKFKFNFETLIQYI